MPKQYLSVTRHKGSIYSKEIDQVTKERSFNVFKDYHFRFFSPVKEHTAWTDIKGNPLKEMNAYSIKEFMNMTKSVQEYGYSLYGTSKLEYQYMYEEFKDVPKNSLIVAGYFDIETARDEVTGYSLASEALNEVLSISFIKNNKIYYWATKHLSDAFCAEHNIEFFWFMHESEMILNFLKFMGSGEIDVLTGWNIESYDIPYVINRAKRLGLNELLFSPFKKVTSRTMHDQFGKEVEVYNIIGLEVLDYLDLYKKFTYVTRDNYKLSTIAQVELGEDKVDYSEVRDLQELYESDFEKFTVYNVKDSLLVKRLDEKLKLINLCASIAYGAGVNFTDALGTVKMWTFQYYRKLMDKHIVPPMDNNVATAPIIGGFVKDPQLGLHDWVVTFDLASLYPHNQMGANISPEMLLEDSECHPDLLNLRKAIKEKYKTLEEVIYALSLLEIDLSALKKHNVCMTPNCQFFKIDSRGFMPETLKFIYEERSRVKKRMLALKQDKENTTDKAALAKLSDEIAALDVEQLGLKIEINSAYGATANDNFVFFDPRIAEAITSIGQTAIQFIARKFNEYFETVLGIKEDCVIASDTDSAYLRFGPVVRKFFADKSDAQITDILDKICKEKMQPLIDTSFNSLADYLNCFENAWKMKREKIAPKACFVAKKRYFMNIVDDEGVRLKEPKLKITGLDAVRSSTSAICREALKKAFKIILTKDEEALQSYIAQFEQEFNNAHILDICGPRSVSDIEKFLGSNGQSLKGTPIAITAAITFNRAIQEADPSYPTIKSGDKLKFICLKKPNKYKSHVIGFPDDIPQALKFDVNCVDKSTQFVKTFLHPLEIILNIIKWKSRPTNDLTDFFS